MKPFLMLAIRGEDVAADDEYAAMLRRTGLDDAQLVRIRMEQRPLGAVDLADWSGVILGGGPYQASDPETSKSPTQRRVEAELAGLLDQVVERDFPFLGCCYGVGTLGRHQGAVVDRTYGEPIGGIQVALTDAGREDPLFAGVEPEFGAYVGHKEAVRSLPGHAAALASSAACPVQAFRVGRRVYATQFHPELDLDGLATRIEAYRYAGYFPPAEADAVLAAARASGVVSTPNLLGRFVELFAR
ncbi:glutamine amidotransferase [Nakamurella sp.]|uniref:glutamine amidotransferase n=1 Tax=Nakamurella sp. TaxID=1869182 RepID=UPI003B3B8DB4